MKLSDILNTPLGTRLKWMVLGWSSIGIVYGGTGWLQQYVPLLPAPIRLPESTIDHWIPFAPEGVWLYLSYFLLIPFAYLRADLARLPWLARAMQLCALVCAVVFLVWPSTLDYPARPAGSLSAAVLDGLIALDSRQNCLPSLHGALTLLCVWVLLDGHRRLRSLLVIAWGLGIGYAVIQTRQHVAIDLGAGVLLGWLAGLLASALLRMHPRACAPVLGIRLLQP